MTTASPARLAFADRAVQTRLIELSESFLYHALDGETEACANLFADDGLWLGPVAATSVGRVEEFRRFCDEMADRGLRFILSHLSAEVSALQEPELCSVSVRCFVYVGAGGKDTPIIARPVRIDFFWKLSADELRIASLSVGFLLEEQELSFTGETPGRTTPLLTAEQSWSPRLEVRDTDGAVRFIDEDEIAYLEADGRRTIVHTTDGEIVVQASIGEIQSLVSERFVRLHRTYLVNGWYVKSLSTRGALMIDGSVLPVPSRRLVALRHEINAIKKPSRLSLSALEQAVRASMTGDS